MASNGSSIRISLDLFASLAGVGSVYTLISAISGIGGILTPVLVSTEAYDTALQSLTAAMDAQKAAALRLQFADEDLLTAQEIVAADETLTQSLAQSAYEADLASLATAELNQGLATQTMATADAAVASQTLAVAEQQEALSAQYAAQQQQEVFQSLGPIAGVAVAAAAEMLAFDASLKAILQDTAALQYTSTQMDFALHGTTAQIAALNPAIIDWADNSIFTTAQVHQLVTALSEHGLDVTDILNGDGQAAIQMAEAMGVDPVDAANLLASSLNMFSDQGYTASQMADLLTGAFYNGIPSTQDLTEGLDMVGGSAGTLGITLPDLLANLDLLAQRGLSASSAGSGLNYMLQAIVKPTNKAATVMNDLGLIVVNQTSPALYALEGRLRASGAAGATAATAFDGTYASLSTMFTTAQKLNLVPLNETFAQWAVQTGIVSDKFFDAKGNFIGLSGSVQELLTTIQQASGGNKEVALNLLETMFNVRSGRAAAILTNIKDYKDHYNRLIQQIGQTHVSKDATQLVDTLAGSWKELNTTFTSFMASVGNGPIGAFFTGLVQSINGFLSSLMHGNPQFLQFIGLFVLVGAILAPIVVLVAAVVGAIILFGTILAPLMPVVLAFGAALAIIPIIAAAVAAGFMWVRAHLSQITPLFAGFTQGLKDFQGPLGTLREAWDNLMVAMTPIFPILKDVAGGIALLLVVIIGLVAGIVSGLITGLAVFLTAIINFVTDTIKGFEDFFTLIDDLIHGRWFRIGQDIQAIFQDLWHQVEDIFMATLGTLAAIVWGFWQTIKAFFIGLYNDLVGHSIIPDMVNGIVSWFEQLPGRVATAVQNLISQVTSFFGNLAGNMVGFGQNMMNGLITGINNMAGAVGNAASNVAGRIKNFLGWHSPTAEGPGADSDQWGPNLMRMLILGIEGGSTGAGNAAYNAAGAIRAGIMNPTGGVEGTAGNQVINVSVGSDPLFQLIMNKLTGQLQVNGAARWAR